MTSPRLNPKNPLAPCILWFRLDLRLEDNPALHAAVATGRPIIPVYIWAPLEEGDWQPGGAARLWLALSIESLAKSFEEIGSRLVVRVGESGEQLTALIRETGANAIYWNRRYEPDTIARDAAIKSALQADGIEVHSTNSALLFEPWNIQTGEGKPYQVFTAFWKACCKQTEPPTPLPAPTQLESPSTWPESIPTSKLPLLPKTDWTQGIRRTWNPGESGAHKQLRQFLDNSVLHYTEGRDIPSESHTSRLSPHLHFGEIGPRQIWHATRARLAGNATPGLERNAEKFLAEVGWREFAYHLLYHFPQTTTKPLRERFAKFPWQPQSHELKAWQRGCTGYPIVDAGMRELWETGWMHNRVRMIVASFLTKDLLIPWQDGARWFWDTLVDADLASNTLGWQWTAGCGADAAPYFRVFNPVSQGEKFDPEGIYVRRYCPELAKLSNAFIHKPWEASDIERRAAGITLGEDYPAPIVDHGEARKRALALFETIKAN